MAAPKILLNFVLNQANIKGLMSLIYVPNLSKILMQGSVFQPFIASLIGLIPNCASSVIISQLYIEKLISASIMMSGLLVNAGVAILVLFRVNRNLKENIKIASILYGIGVISGIILELMGFTI